MPCWKLVRDRIGEELAGRADAIVYRVSGDRLELLLRFKVVEEALELLETGSVEEAADVLEALMEWARVRGVEWSRVEEARRLKRGRLGGFSEGYVAVWPGREEC